MYKGYGKREDYTRIPVSFSFLSHLLQVLFGLYMIMYVIYWCYGSDL